MFFFNPPGHGPFAEVAYGLGLDFIDDGRAFLPIDVDGDGDLDIARISLQSLRLLENRIGGDRHFLRVRLKATKTQHHALGAEVIVEAGGVTQRDYVKITAGFQTQVPGELHFGLGDAELVDRITVRWPSGTEEQHEGQPVDVVLEFHEAVTAAPKVVDVIRWPEASRPRQRRAFSLDLEAERLAGGRAKLAGVGLPVVVNFWAPWCAPCLEELPAIAKIAAKHRSAVRFIGVSVERKDRAAITAAIAKLGLRYDQRIADDPLMVSFFGEDGSAPLPSTFVFDAAGNLSRAFYRKIGAEDLERAIAALAEAPVNPALMLPVGEAHLMQGEYQAARRSFEAGLAVAPDSVPLLTQLGSTLSLAGEHEAAMKTLKRAVDLDPSFPYAWYALGIAHKRVRQPNEAIAALEKAVRYQPKVGKYWMSLGASYSHAKRNEDALEAFERVVAIEPTSIEGWLNLGKARVLVGTGDAGAAFERVLALDPKHRDARGLLEQYGKGPR